MLNTTITVTEMNNLIQMNFALKKHRSNFKCENILQ